MGFGRRDRFFRGRGGLGRHRFGLGRGRNRRRRQGRLTTVGRLAVLVGGFACVGVVLGLKGGWVAWQSRDAARVPLPHVAAAPPLAGPPWVSLLTPPIGRERFEQARRRALEFDPTAAPRLVEWIDTAGHASAPAGGRESSDDRRVEYSLDERLTAEVFEILRKGRVESGHAIVLDPRSGRLLAYVSTNPEAFPPDRAYPAASIVKVLTAAALLEEKEGDAGIDCVYRGNKYRLNRRRLDPPSSGRRSGLEEALATSNNQCFSQWAVHELGEPTLRATLRRFGWLEPPVPGHEAGRIGEIQTRLDLGRLGSGLDGLRVTPLHVAALTSILTDGRSVEPWWVDRIVDGEGRSIELPARAEPRRVMDTVRADRLREMLVATTARGTARGAFRSKRGRPRLGSLSVAGKTGNLTGSDPFGRYEWFVGVAPAEDPRIGVVVLQLQGHLWWRKSSELAASIFEEVFCDRSGCRAEAANRWTGDLGPAVAPVRISDLGGPIRLSQLTSERAGSGSGRIHAKP